MKEYSQSTPSPEEPKPVPPVELRFLVGVFPSQQRYITDQINRFLADHPQIRILLEFAHPSEVWGKIITLASAGAAPDLATLDYNAVATLWKAGSLAALEDIGSFDWGAFLDDAQQSNLFEGQHFGLPWQRFNCSPNYYNLSVFRIPAEKYPAAFQFLTYLVALNNQVDNYMLQGWHPTTKQASQQLGLTCGTVKAIRMTPAQISQVTQAFKEITPKFQQTFGLPLDWNSAVGLFDGDAQIAGGAAFVETLTDEQADVALSGAGLLVGALMVNRPAGSLPLGSFAVLLKADERCVFKCQLLQPVEGGGYQPVYEFRPDLFQQELSPIQASTVSAVEGSYCVCWWKGEWRTCICAF